MWKRPTFPNISVTMGTIQRRKVTQCILLTGWGATKDSMIVRWHVDLTNCQASGHDTGSKTFSALYQSAPCFGQNRQNRGGCKYQQAGESALTSFTEAGTHTDNLDQFTYAVTESPRTAFSTMGTRLWSPQGAVGPHILVHIQKIGLSIQLQKEI
ncbi:hypothetical protein AMECASPLE_023512 [Ameca splendens]|uniref:Uncharacterized protein n=1 Tax=Ameca splendens TaxID=208324 RepID=A0ABV1A0C0_9TELE